MTTSEQRNSLIAIKNELLKKLDAVNLLLDDNVVKIEKTTEEAVVKTEYPPKGDMTWPDYSLLMLSKVGGRSKSKEVSKVIKIANPELDEELIERQTKYHLSKLFTNGVIDAEKTSSKKEGYTYKTKK